MTVGVENAEKKLVYCEFGFPFQLAMLDVIFLFHPKSGHIRRSTGISNPVMTSSAGGAKG